MFLEIVLYGEMLTDGIVCKDYGQVINYLEGKSSSKNGEYVD